MINENSFLPKIWSDFRDGFALLLVAGILLTISMIPAILLNLAGLWLAGLWMFYFLATPSLTGLIYLAGEYAKERTPKLGGYFQYLKRYFLVSLLLWLPTVLFLTVLNFTWEIYQNHPLVWLVIPLGLGIGFLVLFFLLVFRAIALITLFSVSTRTALKYALLLTVKNRSYSVGLLGFTILTGMMIWWGKMVLLLCLPAFWGILLTNLVLLEVQSEQREGAETSTPNESDENEELKRKA